MNVPAFKDRVTSWIADLRAESTRLPALAHIADDMVRDLSLLDDSGTVDPPTPPPTGLRDGLDISNADIQNSPDVRKWAITTKITLLEFRSTGVHVEFDKSNAWPETQDPTRWGAGEGIQFSLWIFFQRAAALFGSGCIEFWKGCELNGGPPEEFAKNWYYDSGRWNGMTGYQPTPGEMVGFMISQGDARNSGLNTLNERSPVIYMPFPASGQQFRSVRRTGRLPKGWREAPGKSGIFEPIPVDHP